MKWFVIKTIKTAKEEMGADCLGVDLEKKEGVLRNLRKKEDNMKNKETKKRPLEGGPPETAKRQREEEGSLSFSFSSSSSSSSSS